MMRPLSRPTTALLLMLFLSSTVCAALSLGMRPTPVICGARTNVLGSWGNQRYSFLAAPSMDASRLVRCEASSVNDNDKLEEPVRRWGGKSLVTIAVVGLATLPVLARTQDVLQFYKQLLTLYPLRTKIATGAMLAVVGDALAQARSRAMEQDESNKYDAYRAASFATFDSCYRVFQHVAFPLVVGRCRGRVLSRLVAAIQGDVSVQVQHYLAATEQMLAYQLCVVPLLYYPAFFTFTGLMQGLSIKDTWLRAKKDFFSCWKRNLLFWAPVQFFMFGFLQEQWQIPFSCAGGIVWGTILSAFAGSAQKVTCVGDECEVE